MTIRPYAESDWDRVREIYALSKPDELEGVVGPAAIRPLDQDPVLFDLFRRSSNLVAEADGVVIGYGGCLGSYMSGLFVHPDHRRRGVGRALLAALLDGRPRPVTLNVASVNTAARALYAAFGFTETRQFTGTFNGCDLDVITMTLSSSPQTS